MTLPKRRYHKLSENEIRDVCSNRHRGNLNSVTANISVSEVKAEIRKAIYEYIKSCGSWGATCDEVEKELQITHQTASARCTELKSLNLVHEAGGRATRSGRRAAVLVANTHSQGVLF